jgi:hypothetical protein
LKKIGTQACFILAFAGVLFATSCEKDDKPGSNPNPPTPPTGFAGEIEWVKTFGGNEEDDVLSVAKSADGSFAVLGFAQSMDGDVSGKTSTDSDYWVIKFSSEGEMLWNKVYGGTDDDRGQKIIATNDGGFAILGFSKSDDGDVSINNGFHDYWVAKLSASGDIEWEKSFGYPGSDQGLSLIQTEDGGYFLVGFLDVTASNGEGNDPPGSGKTAGKAQNTLHGVGEFWGIKLDASGNKEWSHYYGGTNNDRSFGVLQTDDGGFIMVGHSESDDFDITDPQGSYDVWVVRIDNIGNMLWQKNFGGSGIEIGYSITATQDGNFIVVGDTRSTDKDISEPLGNADFWAIKFDPDGNMIWEKTYGGSGFESARSIKTLENGNFLIVGSSRSSDMDLTENQGKNDCWAIIIDSAGDLKWQRSIGGSEIDVANEAIVLNDNSVILAGSSQSSNGEIPENKGSKDGLVIKLK